MKQHDRIPELPAIEGLRRNLLYRMVGAVSGDDMAEIVNAQKEKAMEGDTKAAKLIMDMAKEPSPSTTNISQSTIFMDGSRANLIVHARVLIAMLINLTGPKTTEDVAISRGLSGEDAVAALQCEWFTRDGGKWCLTNKGRTEALEMPSAKLARISAHSHEV